MSEKRDSGPIILGITLLFFLLICVVISVSFASLGSSASKQSSKFTGQLYSKGNIGFVEIEGIITDSKLKVKSIMKFTEDEEIKGLLLYVNSPGGSIGPTEEIYRAVMHAKNKGKKIYVVMGSLCASGGYYIAAAADHIITAESTLTGSIGVIMQMINMTDVYKFLKMDVLTFKSGKYKDIGNPSRPMKEFEKAYIQQLVDDSYSIFLNAVIKGRKEAVAKKFPELDSDEKVAKYITKYADGRIILGINAVKFGLADQIGDTVDALEYIKNEIGEEVKLAKEKKKNKFELIFENLGEKLSFLMDHKDTEVKMLYQMQ
ncbi:signal peptide peptidase SppA [bacterium]|nr:signal peptide peptidase SppA [bacterium]